MQRFGSNAVSVFLILIVFALFGCSTAKYNEAEMAPLATLSRGCMDIVKSNYADSSMPSEINEDQIEFIVLSRGKSLEALGQLRKYDMKIVSNGKKMATVIWDPCSNRKLIEDLRCTDKVDYKAWQQEVYGNDFTLDWSKCDSQQTDIIR